MIAETLRQYLIDKGVSATIYIDFFPAEPDTAVLLRTYAGREPDSNHSYDRPGLQIITRSSAYPTARALAFQVYYALHNANAFNGISGFTHVVDIVANQSPYFIGRDDTDRFSFTQNFRTEIVREV